jgi:hypothetical protein
MANEESDTTGVRREAVYREMYNECRRYRDYEFTSSSWYTALLLAMFGFLVATRFGDTAPVLAQWLAESWVLRVCVVLGGAVIAGTANFLIWYSSGRYQELRRYMTSHLEPKWKTDHFSPRKHRVSPHLVYHCTPWLAVALIAAITFSTIR